MKKYNNKSAFLIVFRCFLIVYIGLFSAVVFSQSSAEGVMNENKTTNTATEAIQHENTVQNISPQIPSSKKKPHQLSNYGASITEMFFYHKNQNGKENSGAARKRPGSRQYERS